MSDCTLGCLAASILGRHRRHPLCTCTASHLQVVERLSLGQLGEALGKLTEHLAGNIELLTPAQAPRRQQLRLPPHLRCHRGRNGGGPATGTAGGGTQRVLEVADQSLCIFDGVPPEARERQPQGSEGPLLGAAIRVPSLQPLVGAVRHVGQLLVRPQHLRRVVQQWVPGPQHRDLLNAALHLLRGTARATGFRAGGAPLDVCAWETFLPHACRQEFQPEVLILSTEGERGRVSVGLRPHTPQDERSHWREAIGRREVVNQRKGPELRAARSAGLIRVPSLHVWVAGHCNSRSEEVVLA
mmetsp:Transcript_33259/g.93908  ORF Transcript_33259/g.93908 Transcript_33259/m.93908 type:complete len:299 (-) Transcript_33259:322-1218(-)